MSSIKLSKGGSINLNKQAPGMKKILIGLGWDTQGETLDLDASAFMIGKNGKLPADEFFVFYNNLKSPDKALIHTGDNRTGEGDGDDEVIMANLSMIDDRIEEILFLVSIHESREKKHNFGLVKNAYIRLYDVDQKTEFAKFSLDRSANNNSELLFGKLVKRNDEWHFDAIGEGTNIQLEGYVARYA